MRLAHAVVLVTGCTFGAPDIGPPATGGDGPMHVPADGRAPGTGDLQHTQTIDTRALTIGGSQSLPAGAPLSGNDDDNDGAFTWAAGNAGRYVLFPNVDVSSPTITLGGDLSGPHTIPVAAGTLTLVSIFFVFL